MITLPPKFLQYSTQGYKQILVVVQIEGVPYVFTNGPIYTAARYGDPGLTYGMSGLTYGGLYQNAYQHSYLNLDSGLTISQRLEPEQGRSSISQLTLNLVDKDGYVSKVVSPQGGVLSEILGVAVDIFVGYPEISYPEDFYKIFRGVITNVNVLNGIVQIQVSDNNTRRRQTIFQWDQRALTSNITSTALSFDVNSGIFPNRYTTTWLPYINNDLVTARTFMKIDNEIIEYDYYSVGASTSTFTCFDRTNVSHNRGTTNAAHTAGAQVSFFMDISGNVVDLALKIMLGGWDGPYLTGVKISSIAANNRITLPVNKDAQRDYGLIVGDVVLITGGANAGLYTQVVGFDDIYGNTNRIIICDQPFTAENPSSATLSLRSQYDNFPEGQRISPIDVDVQGWVDLKNNFLSTTQYSMDFFITASETGKDFIDTQLLLPIAAYSLTRNGQLSAKVTVPPFADQRTTFITASQVINPLSTKAYRGINTRKFFNEIDWEYEFDDSGNSTKKIIQLDTTSLNVIGINSTLPISGKGLRTAYGFETYAASRSNFLFGRYSRGAVLVDIQVNWGLGSQIEAGDIVLVQDNGDIQIPNLVTGSRSVGNQFYEVVNRSLNVKDGNCQLTLIAAPTSTTDRYASISPSSIVQSSNAGGSYVIIQDSFGSLYPGQEWKKWKDYTSLGIYFHNASFGSIYTSTIGSFDAATPNKIYLGTSAGADLTGFTMEIADYNDTSDATVNALQKLIHFYQDHSVACTGSGSSVTLTNSSDAAYFVSGNVNYLARTANWSSYNDSLTVLSVVGSVVTFTTAIGFSPTIIECITFKDGGQPYRII